jgi:hypothetical protein
MADCWLIVARSLVVWLLRGNAQSQFDVKHQIMRERLLLCANNTV